MKRYRYKPFNPKPGTPGAPIEWAHTTTSGERVTRTGVVWSLAPSPGVWVSPTGALPGDLYGLIYVAPAGSGTWRSSDDATSFTGTRTAYAALMAEVVRAHNSRRAA